MARAIHGDLPVGFRYTPGVANTAFFEALRDRGVLLGVAVRGMRRHLSAGADLLRAVLRRAGRPTPSAAPAARWSPSRSGHVDIDGEPLDEPVAIGLVRLDGADTVLMHRLLGVDAPAIGMRVTARVRPASRAHRRRSWTSRASSPE